MKPLFITITYQNNNSCGIAVVDPDRGAASIQIEKLGKHLISHELREIASYNGKYYITTPATIRKYKLNLISDDKPLLIFEEEIIRKDWLLGGKFQANLKGILISEDGGNCFVGNNFFNSVDEIDLKGTLIKRHFIYDIAPEIFTTPDSVESGFRYGAIKSLAYSPNGRIIITIARVNNSDSGIVIDLNSGDILLNELSSPYGGTVTPDYLLVQNVQNCLLSAYLTADKKHPFCDPIWTSLPRPETDDSKPGIVGMRGITVTDETVYCGVSYLGKSVQYETNPRIVSFNLENGNQLANDIEIPQLTNFDTPKIVSLFSNSQNLNIPPFNYCKLFVHGIEDREGFVNPVPASGENYPFQDDTSRMYQDVVNPSKRKVVIEIESVNVHFPLSEKKFSPFKHQPSDYFHALKDINLVIHEGESLGIIGRNGSGKSTVSMVISGTLPPDSGSVTVIGKAQLLSLGLGFKVEFNGRENVFINAALLGMKRQEIQESMDDIIDFSELGSFIDEPVRTYSAGMKSRLAFAVATVLRPDILILDEIMSTGDAAFRKKADKRMEDMRKSTKTIIIVSHGVNQLEKLCSRIIWMDKGIIVMDGDPTYVLSSYKEFSKNPAQWLMENTK